MWLRLMPNASMILPAKFHVQRYPPLMKMSDWKKEKMCCAIE